MSLSRVVEPAIEALDMIRACADAFRPAHLPDRLSIKSTFPHFWKNVEVRAAIFNRILMAIRKERGVRTQG
jgi:hypothetical protein